MTANQINYGRLIEEQRKNRSVEGETVRHNRATEGIQSSGVAAQHAAVGAQMAQVDESRRHNQEQELINWYTTQWQSQRASDQTGIEQQRADAQTQQAYVAARGARIRNSELAESIRHNQEMEAAKRLENEIRMGEAISDLGRWLVPFFVGNIGG